MKRIYLSLILLAFCAIFCSGCGTFHAMTYDGHNTYRTVDANNYGFTKNYPKSFTIYPFKNTTWYQEASERARLAMFQGFSLIGPCTNPDETDKLVARPFCSSDALKVARQQNSDAVIVGEVITQDHFWFIFAAYSYVMLKINIYDTRDGRLLYSGNTWSLDSDWGISFLSPISSLIDHINWSRITMGLYYRCAMDLVHDLRPDVTPTK
ncbi:MAG TPA: hypothetical protein DCZ94_18605 [Lentisphaeria bacterium]|nr:MAG: hypothetical protein A2X48_24165 [Lentisphaerae bacterium GWF2_49_21]HBC88958.1 hypothetical protein [Lentisphaeria bacterium]